MIRYSKKLNELAQDDERIESYECDHSSQIHFLHLSSGWEWEQCGSISLDSAYIPKAELAAIVPRNQESLRLELETIEKWKAEKTTPSRGLVIRVQKLAIELLIQLNKGEARSVIIENEITKETTDLVAKIAIVGSPFCI